MKQNMSRYSEEQAASDDQTPESPPQPPITNRHQTTAEIVKDHLDEPTHLSNYNLLKNHAHDHQAHTFAP
ncbi:hypothetical protein RA263_30065, partial [Pseudomonas syringae pv. tagetis]|uniref:hypothetical protein n=1 Tax=Pseudomonas syringae group genomosp. 7 TaxID=251699 RepID=UPI00376FD37E